MKSVRNGLLLIMAGFLIAVNQVSAEAYYTNLNGVEMNELQYHKMTQLFSDNKIEHLTQEDFNKYKDANIISSDVMYQKITYQGDEVISEEIISEEEYEQSSSGNVCMPLSDTDQFIQTEYKRLSASLFENNGLNIMGALSWSKMPKYRSYDVFAMRFQFFDYWNAYGVQEYYIGNSGGRFDYNSGEPGYKGFATGFGISMNLKDGSNIDGYELTIGAKLSVNTTSSAYANAFVTYQHAQRDLTREQSKSYGLSIAGLGNVLYYEDVNIRNAYDDMAGLNLRKAL